MFVVPMSPVLQPSPKGLLDNSGSQDISAAVFVAVRVANRFYWAFGSPLVPAIVEVMSYVILQLYIYTRRISLSPNYLPIVCRLAKEGH